MTHQPPTPALSRLVRFVDMVLLLTALLFPQVPVAAQQEPIERTVTIANGWHPWYEIKVDPEDANNLIACGSLWNAKENALFGFVYSSSDSGKTWTKVLEDRSSKWVSEQSCAFGSDRRAYFVSEASSVVDGTPHLHQGTARLYVSTDAGKHWSERFRTGWADWSTSAVRQVTGQLFTFFNYDGAVDETKNWGASVGVLVFSQDGGTVAGPSFSPQMRELDYHGIFPGDATSLPDGAVVALYEGFRNTPVGLVSDLGVVRVNLATSARPTFSKIVSSIPGSTKGCMADHALAFDARREKLWVIYGEEHNNGCRAMVATSPDEGETWGRPQALITADGGTFAASDPSVAFASDGQEGLLWKNANEWRFALLNGFSLVGAPVDLNSHGRPIGVISDSLMSVFREPDSDWPANDITLPTVVLNVGTEAGAVWRSGGLVALGKRFDAVFLTAEENSDKLISTIVSSVGAAGSPGESRSANHPLGVDVTRQIALLYGRDQSFDNSSGILSVEIALANRGDMSIRTPIQLKVEKVDSKAGRVVILNADNGLHGSGATWDLSRCVVGDEIPPGATTYNTFTLLFHIDLDRPDLIVTDDLLNLSATVISRGADRIFP